MTIYNEQRATDKGLYTSDQQLTQSLNAALLANDIRLDQNTQLVNAFSAFTHLLTIPADSQGSQRTDYIIFTVLCQELIYLSD